MRFFSVDTVMMVTVHLFGHNICVMNLILQIPLLVILNGMLNPKYMFGTITLYWMKSDPDLSILIHLILMFNSYQICSFPIM